MPAGHCMAKASQGEVQTGPLQISYLCDRGERSDTTAPSSTSGARTLAATRPSCGDDEPVSR